MADGFLGVEVDGLADFGRQLKAAERDLAKEQRRANREVATQVVRWAQSAASGGTRQQAAAARQIRPRATTKAARLAIGASKSAPFARAAFWGSDKRTGWYAQAKYDGSAGRQSKPWVGNAWVAGQRGEGPYVLNDAIADHVEQIEQLYLGAVDRAMARAFPR